ncbi:MAG TPA: DUF971 domain-containing protein [Steroidobacteraceae bacterium]|jgi:DUF971 family protein
MDAIPLSIVLRPGQLLLRWADGDSVLIAASLRSACRCADCRAAVLSGRARQADPEVRLQGAAPVGQYALRLLFNDGHDRGIYPWELLRQLSPLI